ncbi:GTP-binding protein [Acidaminobacter sp. JC074]|uniref:GTP-binding protein n=1 Tax=Acidaminobacter sp. JC074 TaxID=2530199 RepID=UPI002ED54EF3
MKKTIGIFAHVDAGKTTFSEQLLFHTGMIRSLGRVDHKNAALDSHDIEKKRGITVFTDQAYFDYNKDTYYLIDTPGHVDFSSEMERAINILDYAVIVISGIDGIQSHTETVYELLNKAGIPVIFFINKLDAAHADKEAVLEELAHTFTKTLSFDDIPYEGLADYYDDLMTLFFEDDLNEDFFLSEAKKLLSDNKIHPVLTGSALKDIGIKEFLIRLDQLTSTAYSGHDVSGLVYKVKYHGGLRHTYVKLTSGRLAVRDSLLDEKVTDIK